MEGKRECQNCGDHIPPDTTHYELKGNKYCTDCVEAKPYTAHTFYIDGEFIGLSEEDDCSIVEDFEDDYEE
jgi:hypothetical protein